MSLSVTPMASEITKIMTYENKEYAYMYRALVHIMDIDKTYIPLKVMSMDIVRDYNEKISDDITIQLAVSPGTWSDYVFPNINNLEVTIVRRAEFITRERPPKSSRFKAYVKNPVDFRKNNPQWAGLNTETIDHSDIVIVEIQLVPKIIVELLPMQSGTIFPNSTVTNVLMSMLTNEPAKIEGLDKENMLQGVDMVEADNQTQYDNIPIPHDTKLINLPNYLQKSLYGVYNSGINHYIQDGIWFVYPKYQTKRQDAQVRYINVFIVEKNLYNYANNTWRIDGQDLYLVASLESESQQSAIANFVNHGNGVRQINPSVASTKEEVEVKGNKAIANRSNTINEMIVTPNPNGVNHAKLEINETNINIYQRVAEIAGISGNYFSFVWYNSKPEYMRPGSIVRVHYLGRNRVQRMFEGVLMKAHHYSQSTKEGVVNSFYRTTTGFFIFSKENIET